MVKMDTTFIRYMVSDNNGSTYGNSMSFRYGGRTTFGSCWNTMLASVDFVETYENIDGSKFNWDEYIPGFSSLDIKDREVSCVIPIR